jgi:hypothetical protein
MCGSAVADEHRFCASCGAELRDGRLRESPSVAQDVPRLSTTALIPAARPLVVRRARVAESDRDPVSAREPESTAVAVRDPLGSVIAGGEGTGPRIAVAVGIVLLIIVSGVAGYRWFHRSTPLPVAVDGSEQVVDPPQQHAGGSGASRDGRGATPGTEPTRSAESAHADDLWTIVGDATRDTMHPDAALGKPDGRAAVIAPGGALALASVRDEPFYNGHGPDVRVDGPSGDPTPYTIFARSGPDEKWLRFDTNRHGFPNGFALHDFGHHHLEQARQILIRNDGSINLYVDGVTPMHTQPDAHETPDHSQGSHVR